MANIQATISPRKSIIVTNFATGGGIGGNAGGGGLFNGGLVIESLLANQVLDRFSILEIRVAKYTIQATYNNEVHVLDLTITHDGTTVFASIYGEIVTNTNIFTVDGDIDIATNEVRVLVTPLYDTAVIKFTRYTLLL